VSKEYAGRETTHGGNDPTMLISNFSMQSCHAFFWIIVILKIIFRLPEVQAGGKFLSPG
jgi:hypothetical protein